MEQELLLIPLVRIPFGEHCSRPENLSLLRASGTTPVYIHHNDGDGDDHDDHYGDGDYDDDHDDDNDYDDDDHDYDDDSKDNDLPYPQAFLGSPLLELSPSVSPHQ